MSDKHSTVKDIAKKLGLHHSTVSRALRDYPDISETTKKKVIKVAKDMNYTPNTIAQSLKTRKSRLIGIIVPEIVHNFFAKAISGIENVVYKEGFVPIVLQSNESTEREILNVDAMITNRVAGLIASISQNTNNADHYIKLMDKGIPLVFFDRIIDNLDTSRVISDDRMGALMGVEYLIENGYRKIAHFSGPPNLNISKNRLEGYVEALEKNKIQFNQELITTGSVHEDNGYKSMEKMLSRNTLPDAIFAINDPVAVGAYRKIKEEGLKIPDDIAILGFSNNVISSYLDPPLSTIDQFPERMGQTAANILFDQIIHEKTFTKTSISTKLIIRETT
jgi:LacI family transcriptional regulator